MKDEVNMKDEKLLTPVGQAAVGEIPVGQIPVGETPVGQIPVEQTAVEHTPVEQTQVGQASRLSDNSWRRHLFPYGLSVVIRQL